MVDLSHIPQPRGLPLLAHSLAFLRDPYGAYFHFKAEVGDVFQVNVFGLRWVVLAGPDAVEEVFLNRGDKYSAKEGLKAFAHLFSGGLLHRDAEDHRAHRRVMQAAFRAEAMRAYLDVMNGEISQVLAGWPVGRRQGYGQVLKLMSLRLGARVFMGLTDEAEIARMNACYEAQVRATSALLRWNLPFTTTGRGIAARQELSQFFAGMIPARRASGGANFFSQLCQAEASEDAGWTDQEIVDHFNFLLVAAHDPVTSNLAVVVSELAQNTALQETLRAEVSTLPDGPLAYEDLDKLPLLEQTYKEALRRYPPSSFTVRRVMEETEWQGHRLPVGAYVTIAPGPVMMDPDWWSDPALFDPGRFATERAEDKVHRFAWAPFGGGMHKCIGMHFGVVQFKAILVEMLRRYRFTARPEDAPRWRVIPTPMPKNDLPLVLEKL